MANNHSTSKAQRGKVQVAGLEINIYFLPDATYRLAGKNVTDAIGEPNNSLGRIMGVKTLKALPHADSTLPQIKADTGESFIPVAIEDAITYWGVMAIKGNLIAQSLLVGLKENPELLGLTHSEFGKAILESNKYCQPKTQSKKRKQGYIYVFVGIEVVKVGFSTDVETRLRSLSRWSGELTPVLVLKGTQREEKNIHTYLANTGLVLGEEWYPGYRLEEICVYLKKLKLTVVS
jgi:hypothetical protein